MLCLQPEFSGGARRSGNTTVLVASVEVPKPGPGGPDYRKPQLAQTQQVRKQSIAEIHCIVVSALNVF